MCTHTHNLCIRKLGLSQKVRSTPGFTNPWDKEESVWIITRGTTPEAATAQVNWIFLFILRRGGEKGPWACQHWIYPRPSSINRCFINIDLVSWWLKARLIHHRHRWNLIGDFHLVIFAFISVSLSYQGFGQFLQGTEGWALLYYHDFKGTSLPPFKKRNLKTLWLDTWFGMRPPSPPAFETRRLSIMAFMYMDVFDHAAFCLVAAVFECKSLSCALSPFHKRLCVIIMHLMKHDGVI